MFDILRMDVCDVRLKMFIVEREVSENSLCFISCIVKLNMKIHFL